MTNEPGTERITMTHETRVKINAIVDAVYEAGSDLNPEVLDQSIAELDAILRRAFAGGVMWMYAGINEGIGQLADHILEEFDPKVLDEIRKAQEVPHD